MNPLAPEVLSQEFETDLGRNGFCFESHGVSHRGCVRLGNEDGYLADPTNGLWAVTDGMGGHDGGDIASATIIDHLGAVGRADSVSDLQARFEARLNRAHINIRELSLARGTIMGSTVAALLAMDRRYACAWSGDSRVYLIRDHNITQLSRDHSEVQELLDRGLISAAEAVSWPRRNVITQAVGVSEQLRMDQRQGETLPGDVFVLCTDGLTIHVSDAEIAATTRALAPRAACERLLSIALARGATDNVTIIVVRIAEADHDAAAASEGGSSR